ncbi:MAG TPA: hypothetical protein DCO83_11440 [Mucilaginibacter sp.]|jgi:hypothetical protein|nr:hypothetical protein [Mucilaginibacter sp.]
MVTYRVLLDTRRPKSDGTYAVIIRTTFNRKSSTSNTGVWIQKEFWCDNKSNVISTHPNHKLLNKKITEVYLKVQKSVIELEAEEDFSFDGLKDQLDGSRKAQKISNSMSFNQYANQLVAEMFAINKAGNAIIYQTATNRLMGYTNKPVLKFTEINYTFLDGFRRQLIK